MVLAMAAFALEDMFFKAATVTAPVGQSLILFGLIGFLIFTVWTQRRREPVFHPASLSRGLLLRSGIELLGRLFYALALAYAPLASTSAILQATPIVVTLGAIVFFRESVGWRRWAAMAVGFIGVLIVIRPLPGSFEWASLFAVLGMLGFAGRDLATRASPPAMSVAQLGVLGFTVLMVAGGVLWAIDGFALAPMGARAVGALSLAALFGVAAYAALTQAMRMGEIGFVAPFRYTRLIFALILAVLVFGERPDIWVLSGAALIVAAGLYSFLRDGRAR